MAGIQGTILLIDRFSPVLRDILTAVNQTVAAMETTGSVSEDALDSARRAADEAGRSVDGLSDQFGGASDAAEKVAESVQGWNPALLNAASAVSLIKTGISAVQSAWRGISGLLDMSDTQSNAEVQLGIVMRNMGGSLDGYNSVKTAASTMQGRTTFGDEAFLAGAAEIGTYLSDPEAIAALLPTLADYAAGMGGPEADAGQMTQYATNLAKTFVGAFDAMNEKGFVFSDAQKKIMKTGTEMEKVAVLSDVIGEGWGGLAEQFAQTPEGRLISLQNTLGDMKETMGAELYPYIGMIVDALTENLPQIQMMMDGITSVIQGVAEFTASFVIPVVSGAIDWISSHLEGLKLLLLIVGAIALAVGVGMAISWAIANWPIILLGILIVQLVDALNAAGISANDVASEIGAVFGWLYGILYNIFVTIYNLVASVAEFLANVFNDPVTAVTRLFYDLCDTILTILQTIADAIDAVFGTGIGAAIGGFRENLQKWVDDAIPENKIRFERKELISSADTARRGSEMAQMIMNELDLSGLDTTNSMIESMFTPGGVGVTGPGGGAVKTSGEVSLADEDLKYILDATERRYIAYVNLETAAPSIQVSFGDVHETADVDKIEEALAERLDAALPYMSPVGAGQEVSP